MAPNYTQTLWSLPRGKTVISIRKVRDLTLAHSFGDHLDAMREACGDEVASKVGPVWGMDNEGQLQGVWRHCGHDGLWFAMGMCMFLLWAFRLTVFSVVDRSYGAIALPQSPLGDA